MRTLEALASRSALMVAPVAPVAPEHAPHTRQPNQPIQPVANNQHPAPQQAAQADSTPAPRAHPQRRHLLALAGLQVIVGYQLWASGVDKLLFGRFPAAVGGLLAGTLQGGRVPAPFAALMRSVVLPHSAFFGVLVEWGETLAGLGLIAGAVAVLAAPIVERRLAPALGRWVALARRVVQSLALGAAAGGALMGLSFYFIDGAPSQWVAPSVAFGGVLDPGFLVLVGCAAVLADALAASLSSRPHRAQSAL